MEMRWFKPENIEDIPTRLFRVVREQPDVIALEYFAKKIGEWHSAYPTRKISYRELGDETMKMRRVFTSFAPKETGAERVALLMPNIPQFVFGYYGALAARMIAVPVNFSSIAKSLKDKVPVEKIKIAEEIAAQILDSKPRIIVIADFFWPIIEQIKAELKDTAVIVTSPKDFLPFYLKPFYVRHANKSGQAVKIPERDNVFFMKNLIASWGKKNRWENMRHPEHLDPLSIAQLQYTSGTEGAPKGAALTHRNVMSNVWQCREQIGDFLGDGATFLGALPLFHVYGLTICLNVALLGFRGKVVLMPSFDPECALGLIEKKKVDVFPGVSRMFQRMAEVSRAGNYNLSSLKLCISGAGPLDQDAKNKFEAISCARIIEGYGLSETSPVVSFSVPDENKPRSVGKPMPQTTVTIVDLASGATLDPQEEGEIMVSGPQVMDGYFRKPAETANVLKNGVLATGDLGYLNRDNFLYITGRKKEMSKILGENVPWANVEKYLLENPAVRKCAVIGVPDQKTGEALVIFVIVKEGSTKTKIADHFKDAPNKLWIVREIIEVSETTFAGWEDLIGKIKKREVRKYYEGLVRTA